MTLASGGLTFDFPRRSPSSTRMSMSGVVAFA